MARTAPRDEQPSAIDPLLQCRLDIDRVDRVLAALLRERARLALEAGRIKLAAGDPLVVPAREHAVLAGIREMAGAPLQPERLVRIFETIVHEIREAESDWLGRAAADGNDHHGVR